MLEKFGDTVILKPGLSEEEIAGFQSQLPGPLPCEIRDLLTYSAGFDAPSVQLLKSRCLGDTAQVLFTGHEGFELAEAFPGAVPLLPDGCGNFWVLDINSHSGAWGSVFYACHDPAVIVLQARGLEEFLLQLLAPSTSEPKYAVPYVHEEAVRFIWKEDPWLVSVQDARQSQDSCDIAICRGVS
jgi:hypothetical protein